MVTKTIVAVQLTYELTDVCRVPLKLVSGGCLSVDPTRKFEVHPCMQNNEDAYYTCDSALAVADGLGGDIFTSPARFESRIHLGCLTLMHRNAEISDNDLETVN